MTICKVSYVFIALLYVTMFFKLTAAGGVSKGSRDMPPRKRVRSGALRYQLGNIGFRQLTRLITKAELLFTLSGDEDFTLFAPNDDTLGNFLVNNPAIAESLDVNLKTGVTKPNLGMRKRETNCISLQDQGNLKNLLLNHVITGKLVASDVKDGMTLTNLAGNMLEIEINDDGVTVEGIPIKRYYQFKTLLNNFICIAQLHRTNLNVMDNIIVHEIGNVIAKFESDSQISESMPAAPPPPPQLPPSSISEQIPGPTLIMTGSEPDPPPPPPQLPPSSISEQIPGPTLPTSGSEPDPPPSPPQLPPGSESESTPPSDSEEKSELQAVLVSRSLNTLSDLLEDAQLVDTLSGDSELTLFAPTDEALQRFIAGLPNAPNAETIKTVLLNHVIPRMLTSEDITDGLTANNLAGNDLTLRINPESITVGGARVASTDISLLKLTVHILDDVINPFELGTVKEGLKGLGLTELAMLLEDAELLQTLSFLRGTLFAPTNEALNTYLSIMPLDMAAVKNLLLNHVTFGKVFSGDITDGMTARNLAGKAMTIRVTSDGVTVGGASVGRVDKEVLNLVVHILDDVIDPTQL